MDQSERLRTQARGADSPLPPLYRHYDCCTRQPGGVHMEGQNAFEALLALEFLGVYTPEPASP